MHKTAGCAELVCSNSFRGDKLDNAVGLLKEEMRRLGSLIMQAAETARVPAGAALAVDRDRFSAEVTTALAVHPLITIVRGEVPAIPPPRADGGPVIIATGPLTSDALSADLVAHRRRRAPLLLRRDQPDRPRRVDRSEQGVPRLALGSLAARTRPPPACRRRGGRRSELGAVGTSPAPRAAWTTARATT